jgi:hypothetical protein
MAQAPKGQLDQLRERIAAQVAARLAALNAKDKAPIAA